MSRACEICDKRTRRGNKKSYRGKAKYLGGVGVKITGKVRRTFKPNLQKIRVEENGTARRMTVCTRCIKRGGMRKRTVRVVPAATAEK